MVRPVGGAARLLTDLGLVVVVLGVALAVLGQTARTLPFNGDEGDYIEASQYFSFLFVRHDLRRREWRDSRTIHTQGLVPSYLIGGWLWARGHPVEDLQIRVPGDERAEFEARGVRLERIDGEIINVPLLHESRAPMVMVGAALIGVLYLLGRVLAGQIAGLAMAAFGLASPLSQYYLGQARSEPTLALFLLLALLLAVAGARRGRDGGLPFGWALACGAALGLAIGSKYTALLSLAALLVWGLLVAAWAARRERAAGRGALLIAAWGQGRGWALAATVGFAVFVLSNPHFYPDPPRHLWHLVEARREVALEHQQEPEKQWRVVRSPLERARMVVGRALVDDTAGGSRGVPLEACLALFGGGVLLLSTLRGALRTGHLPADGLVLVTVAAYFVGVTAGLSVAWERYFLPTLLVGTVLSGAGLSAAVSRLPVLYNRLRAGRPRAAHRAAPSTG